MDETILLFMTIENISQEKYEIEFSFSDEVKQRDGFTKPLFTNQV